MDLSLTVAVRVDASTNIGSGHFFRCLNLSVALLTLNHKVLFICRNLSEYHSEFLKKFKIPIYFISENESFCEILDAEHTHKLCKELKVDIVVLDVYRLNYLWQQAIMSHGYKLSVLNDVLGQRITCNLLIDYTPGRHRDDYLRQFVECPDLLVGTDFALISNPFSNLERTAPQISPEVKRILISFGGSTQSSIIPELINELMCNKLPRLEDIVILGHLEETVAHRIISQEDNKTKIRICNNVRNIFEYYDKSDLCIGASGVGSLERCFVGLPSLCIPIADNQVPTARWLDRLGASASLLELNDLSKLINQRLREKFTFDQRKKMSKIGMQLIDGYGPSRVAKFITSNLV